MSNETKCNGWTNYETWLVNLWLGDSLCMDAEDGIDVTADYIRELVDGMASAACEEAANGLIAILLNGAIREVDFDEIASHYGEDE